MKPTKNAPPEGLVTVTLAAEDAGENRYAMELFLRLLLYLNDGPFEGDDEAAFAEALKQRPNELEFNAYD